MSSVEVGTNSFLLLETTPSSCLAISSLRAYLTSKETDFVSSDFLSVNVAGWAMAGVGVEWSMKSIVPSLYLTCLTVDSYSFAFGEAASAVLTFDWSPYDAFTVLISPDAAG